MNNLPRSTAFVIPIPSEAKGEECDFTGHWPLTTDHCFKEATCSL